MNVKRVQVLESRDPVFNTPREAIAWKSELAPRAKQTSHLIRGQRVAAVLYTEQAVEIVLPTGRLRLDAGPTGLEWDYIETDANAPMPVSSDPLGAIELEWSTFSSVWRRDESVRQLIGCELRGVFATRDHLYVYPPGRQPLGFCGVFDVDLDRPMLFWQWDDETSDGHKQS